MLDAAATGLRDAVSAETRSAYAARFAALEKRLRATPDA